MTDLITHNTIPTTNDPFAEMPGGLNWCAAEVDDNLQTAGRWMDEAGDIATHVGAVTGVTVVMAMLSNGLSGTAATVAQVAGYGAALWVGWLIWSMLGAIRDSRVSLDVATKGRTGEREPRLSTRKVSPGEYQARDFMVLTSTGLFVAVIAAIHFF